MKSTFLLLILFVFSLNADAQSWLWARGAGISPSQSSSNAVVTDAHGNVYIAGSYSGNGLDFGSDTLYGTGHSIDEQFIFLVKYDSSGNVLWAQSTGIRGNIALSLATDASGNVYMTGYFSNHRLVFGIDTLTNDTITNQRSMLLVKYDGMGNVLWARTAPSQSGNWIEAYSVCTDVLGNVFVSGSFTSSQLIFGTDTLKNRNGVSAIYFW